jgi:hypothetical protein
MLNNNELYVREKNLSSVIVDLPEFFAAQKRKRAVKWVWIISSTFIFSILGALLVMEFFLGGARQLVDDSIVLTVKVSPENVNGVNVLVDDNQLNGNPPYLILKSSLNYHSIVVSAPGYETVTKDMILESSQIVNVNLQKK